MARLRALPKSLTGPPPRRHAGGNSPFRAMRCRRSRGEYYHTDLIGLPCVSTEGAAIGTCVAVENFGASDVLEIERPDGKTFMVPMTPAAVLDWSDARILIEAAFAA